MFKFLGKIFRFKSKELEAKLHPNANCPHTGAGEIEASFYTDKTISIELSIKHSRVPTGTDLEFYVNGKKLGSVLSKNGFGKKYLKLQDSNLDFNVGTKAEIRINGAVMYEGEFRPD